MDLEYFVKTLSVGLALDVDETLSQTMSLWIEELSNLFGNPENLSSKEIIKKYRYTWNVPYWQTPEVNEWISDKVHDNELQKRLPLVPGALEYVNKINEIIPISAYITARPDTIITGTQEWLDNNGFPFAPVITRPIRFDRKKSNKWKAGVLEYLQDKVLGIVDDNSGMLEHFNDYKGTIFLYNHDEVPDSNVKVYACPTWEKVFEKVKKEYS